MNKPPSEKASRAQLLDWAKKYGCHEDLLKIFAKYDDLLRGCKNEEERKTVQIMAITEVNNFFGRGATPVRFKDGTSIVIGNDNVVKG
jgi:hypothetical protein